MKLKHIGLATVAVALFASCADQMEYEEYTIDDKDYVSEHWGRVQGILTSAYNKLDYDFGGNYSGAMLSSATDESIYAVPGNKIEGFFNGAWSPTNDLGSIWSGHYEGISYCNLFLDEFNNLIFPQYLKDKEYAKNLAWYQNFQFEARFLRAYYYFNLVRSYGDVPFKTSNISAEEANALPRTPYAEIFKFIDDECAAIKDTIIKDYNNVYLQESGRVNDLTVMALRARAALYHASPLFNKDNDKSLWEAAEKVTKELIDACEARGLKLVDDYSALFLPDSYETCTSELIFGRRVLSTSIKNSFEKYNFPVGLTNASGGNCPSQSLIDAYEMSNGKLISDPESGYDPQNPYEGRDSRLTATVAINGEHFPNVISSDATVGIQSFVGGVNGPVKNTNYSASGCFLKKYIDPAQVIANTNSVAETNSARTWVVYRLAEFYLNYAEILMNLDRNADAVTYVNKVRARAKQPALDVADLDVERYRNERFVELAFEGHRFYDVRRWLAGDKYFTKVKTMTLTKNDDGSILFTPGEISRDWNDKYYFFPIPMAEMLKTNGDWNQNPGWGK